MYWYNGKLVESQTIELDINDPGLLYGATVFTTLRVYNCLESSLSNWQPHCDRLYQSIQKFNWPQPNWHSIYEGAKTLSQHFPVLRITIFSDGREWIIGRFLPENLVEKQKHGIAAALASPELMRSLPGHKTGNYLSAWLAKNSITAAEAILVDPHGNWLETSTGNLWGWKDHCWWTPPLSCGILPGIGRSQLITQTTIQQPWTPEIVPQFEAIAYSNSVVEIIPIHTVHTTTGSLKYNPYHPGFSQLRH